VPETRARESGRRSAERQRLGNGQPAPPMRPFAPQTEGVLCLALFASSVHSLLGLDLL
jgi:hypothetical protein